MLTYPVLGEERRSDTWYMPLVLPERLEFLWKDTNMQIGRKQRKVAQNCNTTITKVITVLKAFSVWLSKKTQWR